MRSEIGALRVAAAALAVAVAAPAWAQKAGAGPGGPWSVASGTSVGQGRMAFQATFGWPGIFASGQYGLTGQLRAGPSLDLTSSGAARLVLNSAVGLAYRL